MKVTAEEKKMLIERIRTERQGPFLVLKGMCVGLVDGETGEINWLPEEKQMLADRLIQRLRKATEFQKVEEEMRKAYAERNAEFFRAGGKHNDRVEELENRVLELFLQSGLKEYRFYHADGVDVLRADGTMTHYPFQEREHVC
jgi:hypothetical protein